MNFVMLVNMSELLELLREAADSVQASQVEREISDFRREYRVDLEKRLREYIQKLKEENNAS